MQHTADARAACKRLCQYADRHASYTVIVHAHLASPAFEFRSSPAPLLAGTRSMLCCAVASPEAAVVQVVCVQQLTADQACHQLLIFSEPGLLSGSACGVLWVRQRICSACRVVFKFQAVSGFLVLSAGWFLAHALYRQGHTHWLLDQAFCRSAGGPCTLRPCAAHLSRLHLKSCWCYLGTRFHCHLSVGKIYSYCCKRCARPLGMLYMFVSRSAAGNAGTCWSD